MLMSEVVQPEALGTDTGNELAWELADALCLPERLSIPHRAYLEYSHLPSLTPPHQLDETQLTHYHFAFSRAHRVSHALAGAWCGVELAQLLEQQGSPATAHEVKLLAADKLRKAAQGLKTAHYTQRADYYERYYRTQLMQTYLPYFLQTNQADWPSFRTPFQTRSAHIVDTQLMRPLLRDRRSAQAERSPDRTQKVRDLSGLLGEVIVLQAFNRLQDKAAQEGGAEYNDWMVVPASTREDTRDYPAYKGQPVMNHFDVKVTFPDLSFVPIQVRWSRRHEAAGETHNPQIAYVFLSDIGERHTAVADTLAKEAAGIPLSKTDTQLLTKLTDYVLETASAVEPSGGVYEAGTLEAASASLALAALNDRVHS